MFCLNQPCLAFFRKRLPILIGLLLSVSVGSAQQIELKNGFFYLDSQKFFIKGIGYEVGATPGHLPWASPFSPSVLQADMQRIVAGGFNTIRTWRAFSDAELSLIQPYGIKIIMGIWIDPHADFSDPVFVNQAKAIVNDVLDYSQNHDNIIAYLIMNEPLPETVAAAGYDETVALWQELIAIIHARHPGRPVSIANTCNGTYIDPDVFDFSGHNAYVYNPVTVNFLHGFRDYVGYLMSLKDPDVPLVITEFGLSVSPSGPGAWGYGGNSLAEQTNGVLHMYKSLVDGGAAGSCVFNYSDGWWKAGNEFAHDDAAEEWFGLVGYTGLSDQFGQERPVWDAVRNYQSAIITEPRSGEIYSSNVPLEIFPHSTIYHMEVLRDNALLYQHSFTSAYFRDTLFFSLTGKEAALLEFRFYDAGNNLIKTEEKNILLTGSALTLPSIGITVLDSSFWQTGTLQLNYQITKPPDFSYAPGLDYIFYPHQGFDFGQPFQYAMPAAQQFNFLRTHFFSSDVDVITVGAAFDISYSGFQKRIYNQRTFSRINAITTGLEKPLAETGAIYLNPNPVKEAFSVILDRPQKSSGFAYSIYNSAGVCVQSDEMWLWDQAVNVQTLVPGIYFVRISPSDGSVPVARKIVKY